jgi:pseudaminic acid synthase
MDSVQIAGRTIGAGCPVFIVAELSANHHGRLAEAVELVRIARRCGADAVKLQTYTADTLTLRSTRPCFRIDAASPWRGEMLYDLYRRAATPWEWYPQLAAAAANEGLVLFSTPFDATAVDFLERHDSPAYKIASFELVDHPLLAHVGSTGKPVVLSTGMATLAEIREAVAVLRAAKVTGLILLKCTSAYPASADEMNLRAIPTLAREFGLPVGLSDHSLDLAIPVAATALGASVVEKHLILSRASGGPDSAFSLEPDEFAAMVAAVRTTERALGSGEIAAAPSESECRSLRRSLFAVEDIAPGELLTARNVRSLRPAAGLEPKYLNRVLGRPAAKPIERGTPLQWDLIG